jgi:hypothetical protein
LIQINSVTLGIEEVVVAVATDRAR